MKTLTMPAATGTQNGNGISISILNQHIQIVFENILFTIMMNAAAPYGAPPRRINDGNVLKSPCPAVPKERP